MFLLVNDYSLFPLSKLIWSAVYDIRLNQLFVNAQPVCSGVFVEILIKFTKDSNVTASTVKNTVQKPDWWIKIAC